MPLREQNFYKLGIINSTDGINQVFNFRMSRPGYKTKSDTMLLRRLINNLKERGSEVAGELERKAHNFLTDVQIKRKKKPEVIFHLM